LPFLHGHDFGIDFSTDGALCRIQGLHHLGKSYRSDDENVDVAVGMSVVRSGK
jgi:hypothetical protein